MTGPDSRELSLTRRAFVQATVCTGAAGLVAPAAEQSAAPAFLAGSDWPMYRAAAAVRAFRAQDAVVFAEDEEPCRRPCGTSSDNTTYAAHRATTRTLTARLRMCNERKVLFLTLDLLAVLMIAEQQRLHFLRRWRGK